MAHVRRADNAEANRLANSAVRKPLTGETQSSTSRGSGWRLGKVVEGYSPAFGQVSGCGLVQLPDWGDVQDVVFPPYQFAAYPIHTLQPRKAHHEPSFAVEM